MRHQTGRIHSVKLQNKFESGLKHHKAGSLKKARQSYLKVLKADPRHNDALHMLGLLDNQSGNYDQAIKHLATALEDNGSSPELLTNFGNALYSKGRLTEAIKAFRRAIEINPRFYLAHNNLGNALQDSGQSDEALSAFQEALKLSPNYAQAHYNLANTYAIKGQHEKAVEWYRSAIAIDPGFVKAYKNLAKTLMDINQPEQAVKYFKRVLDLDKSDALSKHLLSALQGETTSTAPKAYIIDLFDGVSGSFDQHLVDELGYQAPELLFAAVEKCWHGSSPNNLDVLDLGCGTGLCGQRFRPLAAHLVGVDLSTRMIAAAGKRKIYDQLIAGDINNELANSHNLYDIVLAGDVFIYVGDLEQAFASACHALKPGGLFAFSLESCTDDSPFVLRRSGRYAHSMNYVRALSAGRGLSEAVVENAVLRKENDTRIDGFICVFKKTA